MTTTITIPPPDKLTKTEPGWIFEIPLDMAQAMGVAEGSVMVLYPKKDSIEAEVLPPLSPDWAAALDETYAEHKDAFEEMKRLGD